MNEEEATRSMRSLVAEAAGTEHAAGETAETGRETARAERAEGGCAGGAFSWEPARPGDWPFLSVEQSNITCSRRPHQSSSNRRAVRKTAREPDGAFGWLIGPFALARPAQLRVGPRLTSSGFITGWGPRP